jgi:hypothetical protein
MPLYEQATIYAADDSTVLTTISSDPAAAHPHLDGMDGQGEAQVNFIQGTATIGQLVFRVLDVPTIAGNQSSGYFTSILPDGSGNIQLKGRRVVYGRQQTVGGAYVSQFDGLIEEVVKESGTSMVFYRVACRDIRERTRQTRIYTTSFGTTIMPRGVINGYGTFVGGAKLVNPVTPLHGTFWRDPNGAVAASSGRVKLDVTWRDLHLSQDWAKELLAVGTPSTTRDPVGNDLGQKFSRVRIYWRAEGSGGAYNVLANMPVVAGTTYPTSNLFPFIDNMDLLAQAESTSWQADYPAGHFNMTVVMNAAGAVAIPTHLQRIEMFVEYYDTPTERYPLYIEKTVGQWYKDLLDGVYSDYNPSIRYDTGAMAAMVTNTPVVRAIITAPDADMLAWSETNLLKPFGYAPAIVNGLLTPVKYALPDVGTPLLQINDAITREDASWAHTKDGVINTIDFKFTIESLRKATWAYDPEIDRIDLAPGEVFWQNATSAALLGLQDISYEPVTVRSFPGGGALANLLNDFGGRVAGQRIAEARDRFLFGDQRITAPCLRSDAGVAAAKVGDWAQVQISWLPELTTGQLGTNRLMQIVKVQETDSIWRTLELSDAGPGVTVTGLPVLGALSLTGLFVNAPVTSVPAGGEARVDFAVAVAQPAADDGAWQQGARLAANGTAVIGPFSAGQTVWVRVRGEQVGKRRSAWTAGSSIVVTVGPTVTGPVTVTFDTANVPTVSVPVDANTLGVRFNWAVIAQGTEFVGAYTNTTDVAVAGGRGTIALPTTVPFGMAIVVSATPYSGFTAGAVSGTAGATGETLIDANFGAGEAIEPVLEEISSTTGTVGTLTIQVTDPQLRLTKMEFAHQSGNGAWSAWVQDSVLPYADSVTISESMGGKIAYRATGYDANGVLRILKTNEISFTLGNAPEVPKLTLSVSPAGNLIATLTGDSRTASLLTTYLGASDPTLAAIRAGSVVNARAGTVDFGAMTPGVDYHVGVLAYTGTGGTGAESQPVYARITRTDVVAGNPHPPVVTITQSAATAPTVSTETVTIAAALGAGAAGPLTWRKRQYAANTVAPAYGAFQPNSGGTALPFEYGVTRGLKWTTILEVQATDGVRTTQLQYFVASKIDFFTDGGDPVRGRAWDDGGYSGRATNTTGLQLHLSVVDSRLYALNTHFNTAQHTADNVPTGGLSRVIPFSVLRSGDDRLVTGTSEGAILGARTAAAVSRGTHSSVWTEMWDTNPSTGGAWNVSGGTVSITASTDSTRGPNVLLATGYTAMSFNSLMPFDPNKLYRFRIRIRKYVDETSGVTGVLYAGVLAYLAGGGAANSNSGANYCLAAGANYTVASGWQTLTCWIKGASLAFGGAQNGTPAAADPRSPGPLNTGTVTIQPYLLLNYPATGGTPNGTYEVDFYEITEQDEDAENRTYQTVASTGNLYRARALDDALYGLRSGSTDGRTLTALDPYFSDTSQYVSSAYQRGYHTLDNISDGAVYANVLGVVANLITSSSSTRRLSASLYQTANTTVPNNTWTDVLFGGEDFDADGLHSASNAEIVLPNYALPGVFLIIGIVEWSANGAGYREAKITRRSGVSHTDWGSTRIVTFSNSGLGATQLVVAILQASANDAIRMQVFQNSGVSVTTISTNTKLAMIHLW